MAWISIENSILNNWIKVSENFENIINYHADMEKNQVSRKKGLNFETQKWRIFHFYFWVRYFRNYFHFKSEYLENYESQEKNISS